MSLPPWLAEAWRAVFATLASGRLHHALLVAAPAGFGKRELGNALIAAALCTQRGADGHACGTCRGCRLVAAGSHPDLVRVSFEIRDDGKPRTEITVDQIRLLAQRLAMSSQFGGLQIACVDPADRMNASAANALLKTLEEPATSTVIILVADEPSRLPATIRSRCQRIVVSAPSREAALSWLGERRIEASAAAAALDASLGNPGLASEWSSDGTIVLRSECLDDLTALTRQRCTPLDVADRWAADRPEIRLWLAAALARDEARALAKGDQGVFGLTRNEEIPKLATWFDHANRARSLLATSVRSDLVLLDLLRTWQHEA